MTKKRAERLTGYEIRELSSGADDAVSFGAFNHGDLVATGKGQVEWLALQNLVRAVYRSHSMKVLEQYGWRCARCNRVRRLQIHHRKYRSHGGTDRVENLEPVCWDCHRLIHSTERSE